MSEELKILLFQIAYNISVKEDTLSIDKVIEKFEKLKECATGIRG